MLLGGSSMYIVVAANDGYPFLRTLSIFSNRLHSSLISRLIQNANTGTRLQIRIHFVQSLCTRTHVHLFALAFLHFATFKSLSASTSMLYSPSCSTTLDGKRGKISSDLAMFRDIIMVYKYGFFFDRAFQISVSLMN